MKFHLARSAHHAGEGVEDHGALEGHGGERVFFEVLDLGLTGEAFFEPIGVMLIVIEFLGSGIEIDATAMEGFEAFARFL